MKRAWLGVALLILAYSGAVRAEALGLGGGLAACLLDLRGLKTELVERGAPPESLALVPDFAPLPHLAFRGRLGLPLLISGVQLEVGRLALALPVDLARRTWLSLSSTVISFSLLGEVKALFLSLVLGLGTDLSQGQLGLSSMDPSVIGVIADFELGSRPWSVAAVHGSVALEFLLGPVRLYFEGKYLHALSQRGLGIGPWEAGLGLMITI